MERAVESSTVLDFTRVGTITEINLTHIRDRQSMIRLFDGYATDRMEELDAQKLRRPLVKTNLLELVDADGDSGMERLRDSLGKRQISLEQLEQNLFLISDSKDGPIGFLESLTPRVLALYSILKTQELDPWIRRLVWHCPDLDHVWLSGLTFNVLWKRVVQLSRPHRFTQIRFTHDSIFDIDGPFSQTHDGGRFTHLGNIFTGDYVIGIISPA